MPFQGWTEAAQRFFIGLELDNSKAYFTANKKVYEDKVRGPMEAMLAELEPDFGPGKIFRINRDVRFSADKSPYKTNIAATVVNGSKGGYVSLSAHYFFAATGPYHMDKRQLGDYRRAVDAPRTGAELETIIAGLEDGGYQLYGDELKTSPQGYPRDHPRVRLLRRKGLAIGSDLGLGPWLGTAEVKERVATVWRDCEPVVAWFIRNAPD
jgi:uncharacterized protein (TIGR02453 family)